MDIKQEFIDKIVNFVVKFDKLVKYSSLVLMKDEHKTKERLYG